MLRTFTAAAIALSLIAGPALAQGQSPAPNASAPITKPAKADAKTATIEPATKGKMAHVEHVKHVQHAKHAKHIKHAKRVKQLPERTRG